jgi:hypothetical protein
LFGLRRPALTAPPAVSVQAEMWREVPKEGDCNQPEQLRL